MRPLALMLGLVGVAILPYECSAQVIDNPFAEYFQRDVRISTSGGDANDTNAAIHTIDPWPRYARHTRIPGNGREAVGAVRNMYGTEPNALGGSSSGPTTTTTSVGGPGGISTSTTTGGGGGY
jgi:hypothetical protein